MKPLCLLAMLLGAGDDPQKPYAPRIEQASDQAALSMQRIRLPAGWKIELFAAEPMLANPVCFAIDHRNRIYVAETFRLHDGVTDIRGHMNWLDDDLASRTVEDRVTLLKKYLGDKVQTYGREHDRIRLLEDTRGTGKADRSVVFADGFKNIPDGIGAGLLARGDKLWWTCIPDLWQFQRDQATGLARGKPRSLANGFGVHVGFLGHDLHGLKLGPDGKLYFSIGDRGFHVVTAEKKVISNPDSGAVLRCDPDGGNLEIVHSGLRNPQELAFDELGNLFTVDNNADGGDKAKVVQIVEGGDSGWRIGYQFINTPVKLGMWNWEKLWQPMHDGQPAYIVPPIANLADGPSGLVYYPGTGLGGKYANHFLLADFRGTNITSGIRAFSMKPKGATFALEHSEQPIWNVLATDVDFGTDGAVYVLDWVEGWNKTGRGRIYKVTDTASQADPIVAEVKHLLAEGFAQRKTTELEVLLGHADQRVRMEAQFALVDRRANAALERTAKSSTQRLARLHAIWGLGQLGGEALNPVLGLLSDKDAEICCQAARVLGDGRVTAATAKLIELCGHDSNRARFFALLALAKLGAKEAMPAILKVLEQNDNQDPYLRHACVMALMGAGDEHAILARARQGSPAIRLGCVLALRRLKSGLLHEAVGDRDAKVAREALTAMADVPVPAAAAQISRQDPPKGLPEQATYRLLNAKFRNGEPSDAASLASETIAGSVTLRVEALRMLAEWEKPSGRDRVTGLWRPLLPRSANAAAQALRPFAERIAKDSSEVVRQFAITATRLNMTEAIAPLFHTVTRNDVDAPAKIEALKALEQLKSPRLPEAIQLALKDPSTRLRTEGRRMLARLEPEAAVKGLAETLQTGSTAEKQGIFSILAEMKTSKADELLAQSLDRLLAGQLSPELHLDIIQAAEKRSPGPVRDRLAKYESSRPRDSLVAKFRESMHGGRAAAGRQIFAERTDASCIRCHKIGGEGSDVGPDLSDIGAKQSREYLLEAIVDPNKTIAKGYESVILVMTAGQIHVGVVKEENDRELRLQIQDGTLLTVQKKLIDEKLRAKSGMPEDMPQKLTREEIRDLLEYLASLKK